MVKPALVIIDPQNDFHEGGSLAVPGADNDSARIAKMIEENIDKIGEIFVTLDSHHREHVAHAGSWNSKEDGTGDSPTPFTLISHDDIVNKKWFPKDITMSHYIEGYTKLLEEKGRFKLTIWPDHCIIGSEGHKVVSRLQQALDAFVAKNPTKPIKYINKGMNNLTEMYSAIEAEVPIPADPLTQTNFGFLADLKNAPKVIVCGQALSHCVNYTTRDIVRYWDTREPADIVLLLDGASPVPGCEADAEKFIADMRSAGLTLQLSTEVFVNQTLKPSSA